MQVKKSEIQRRRDNQIAMENYKLQQRISNVSHKIHFDKFDQDFAKSSKYQQLHQIYTSPCKETRTIRTSSPIFPKSTPLVDTISPEVLRKIQSKSTTSRVAVSEQTGIFKKSQFVQLPKLLPKRSVFYEKIERIKEKNSELINKPDFNKQTIQNGDPAFSILNLGNRPVSDEFEQQ
ncbi:hypothetical protein SS50377_20293 [Spironucleus salmonicida]|uniref:Uncharacterized protein n=1 Tax=Spironucleus salmonicida TaxID=348837 RepID=V6LLB4_9EUKA|nr:hypothetical protein SS50377_20293 [Spironucleus salmonicida]|eukprot:EST45347.1 Hypothetical protein SS50377_14926 [Spironucleus salmonicida]